MKSETGKREFKVIMREDYWWRGRDGDENEVKYPQNVCATYVGLELLHLHRATSRTLFRPNTLLHQYEYNPEKCYRYINESQSVGRMYE